MLLLYKNKFLTNKKSFYFFKQQRLLNLYRINMPGTFKSRILIFSLDINYIKQYLVPIYFFFKDTKAVSMFYRFITIRSITAVTRELKRLRPDKNVKVILAPTKHLKLTVNTLVRFRIPFFFNTGVQSHSFYILNHFSFLSTIYALLQLQQARRLFFIRGM